MEPLRLQAVAEVVRGTLAGMPAGGEAGEEAVPAGGEGAEPTRALRLSTDSRWIRPGDLFVCLEGPRFDGHTFAAEAIEEGAVAVMAHRAVPAGVPAVMVDDTLVALGRLGAHVRSVGLPALEGRVIGVTGTNGKTSTKDLTAAALSARFTSASSERSYNNAIGVPLTLLGAAPETEALVVEMGTNRPGDIAELCALARPEIGVITNIDRGHLEGLGSLQGVRAEKSSLLTALDGRALAVLNRDDASFEWLARRAPGRVLSFGTDPRADLVASNVHCSTEGTTFVVNGEVEVSLRMLGRHAVSNALAALACARALDVDLPAAAAALGRVLPPSGRLQVRPLGDVTLIDDSYNANPASLGAAIAALSELNWPGRLMVVLGDMLELGEASPAAHEQAGQALAAINPAVLVAVGRHAASVLKGARDAGLSDDNLLACDDWREAADRLTDDLGRGDVVLVKGSRGVVLDRLVQQLVDLAPTVA